MEAVVSIQIFNRWGKEVYRGVSLNSNIANQGWDGKVNGKDAPEGVYVYLISILYEDGVVRNSSGTVTLVR